MNIFEYLSTNSYPGRGIIVGKYDQKMVFAYFIMGRSENSRNRVFAKDGDTVYTKAFDESKVQDPSLIIYNAIRSIEKKTIVTNGNQTDTIYDYLVKGQSMQDGLSTREYEPDAPNYTPRISALINEDESYTISILKRVDEQCARLYYDYQATSGKGHFISTYDHDGNPLPSFSSEPKEITIDSELETFASQLWNSLNETNKISLCVRYFDENGYEEKIFNKNED